MVAGRMVPVRRRLARPSALSSPGRSRGTWAAGMEVSAPELVDSGFGHTVLTDFRGPADRGNAGAQLLPGR